MQFRASWALFRSPWYAVTFAVVCCVLVAGITVVFDRTQHAERCVVETRK